MSNQNLDFDFLARETLALTEQLRNDSFAKNLNEHCDQLHLDDLESTFDLSYTSTSEHSLEPEIDHSAMPLEGPGIVYKLEKGISTFCLRGVATSDLDWERDDIERGDRNLMKKLRLSVDDSGCISEDIGFFPTYDVALAETVVDQLMNRRFPRQEAIVCNLSDPGFSWWLSCESLSFQVYFQSHGIERDENLIQLGPLGDPFIAYQFFNKSFQFLKSKFSINEFSATEQGFGISCARNSEHKFQQFIQLFVDGSFPWEDEMFEEGNSDDKRLLLYFYELSLLRKFWVEIQCRLY